MSQAERRVKEAQKLGFKRCVLPAQNLKGLSVAGIEVIGVKRVEEALEALVG